MKKKGRQDRQAERPKLTKVILDRRDIRVYITGGADVWPLPTETMPGFHYRAEVGTIKLYSPTDWDVSSGYRIRYVLIPGGVHAAATKAGIDLNDYRSLERWINEQ